MKFQPIHRSRIVAALQEAGPMTRQEIADYLDLSAEIVGACIASTRWLLPQQIFRIARYQPVTGRRSRDLAVYAAEAGADALHIVNRAKRRKQAEARYREKHRASINARGRTATMAPVNPWLQLAPPEIRGAMSLQGRIQGSHIPHQQPATVRALSYLETYAYPSICAGNIAPPPDQSLIS